MIEVRQARYFLAVAEQLNVTRAAAELGMSQPPLSQAIRQLERQVGARLLNRTSGGITLTKTGEAFADECRTLVRSAQRAHDVAAQSEAGLIGTLRIGAVTSALSEPLLGTMAAFRRSRPHANLEVVEVDTPTGYQALLRRDIDVAVIRINEPTGNVTVRPWRRDHLVIALPPEHPLTTDADGPLSLSTFAEESWVWLHREISPDYHDRLMAVCRQAGFTPQANHRANSITTQLAMVACGLGVTLVPSAALAPSTSVAHRSLLDRTDLVEVSIVTRADADEPLTRHFLRLTRHR